MSRKSMSGMRPHDVVVLLKIRSEEGNAWTQVSLAKSLCMSQSEISESLARSFYSRLLFEKGRKVARQPLLEFIQYGLPYVFPQQPGNVVRGIPTAHSALPLKKLILGDEQYVWPYAKGSVRGHSVQPLFNPVLQVVEDDETLYAMLALIDAIRVGKARERSLAIGLLKDMIR